MTALGVHKTPDAILGRVLPASLAGMGGLAMILSREWTTEGRGGFGIGISRDPVTAYRLSWRPA